MKQMSFLRRNFESKVKIERPNGKQSFKELYVLISITSFLMDISTMVRVFMFSFFHFKIRLKHKQTFYLKPL